MILFYEPKQKDAKIIERDVSKAFGTDKIVKIHGFSDAFLFDLPPIYLSPRLSEIFEIRPAISDTLSNILKRFLKEDYGEVSDIEECYNRDQRRVFNSYADMVGRYRTPIGFLILELYASKGIIRLQGEHVDV